MTKKKTSKTETLVNRLNLADMITETLESSADQITKILLRGMPDSLDFSVEIHICPVWGLRRRLRAIDIRACLNNDVSIVLNRIDLRDLLLADEFHTCEGVESAANAKAAAVMLHSLADEFELIAKDYWAEEWTDGITSKSE